jgi:hypothetical protein
VAAVWQHGRESVVCYGKLCGLIGIAGGIPVASQYFLQALPSALVLRSLNEHFRSHTPKTYGIKRASSYNINPPDD